MKAKIFLETFGCQMNELDSELVQGQLLRDGHSFVDDPLKANVVLLNTCSVRALSEQKVVSRLGIIKKRKSQGEKILVGVLGCMAERANVDILKNSTPIDLLAGPSNLHEVAPFINEALAQEPAQFHKAHVALSNFRDRKGKSSETALMDSLEALDSTRPIELSPYQKSQAYVRITRGCNKFCSFCVVPRTRGPEIHRHPQAVIDEVKRLVDQGFKEVTLLGQTINHYYYDDTITGHTSFADLLFRIHEEVPQLPRLRFLTSYPRDFTDEALQVMANCPRINHYLHIPAQSGSNRILQRMNRGYTTEIYLSLIERARKYMPNISLLGDMIVGFSGETDADFEASMNLLRQVQYKGVFVFKYSPRPGTVANKNEIDDVPVEVKKERNNQMLALQRDISFDHHRALLGQKIEVLIECLAKIDPHSGSNDADNVRLTARTRGDHLVNLSGPKSLIGQLKTVEITAATALALSAKII